MSEVTSSYKRTGKTYRYCNKCNEKHPIKQKCNIVASFSNNMTCKNKKALPKSYRKYLDEVGATSNIFIRSYNSDYCHRRLKKQRGGVIKDPILKKEKKNKKQDNKKIGECPICLTPKKNNTILGCNHSICHSCYDKILISDNLEDKCPLCRTDMFSENWFNYFAQYTNRRGNQRQFSLTKLDWEDDLIKYTFLIR
jgi:hypothetical protein